MTVPGDNDQLGRPVDSAMAAERPEKEFVRNLWINKAIEYNEAFPDKSELLYLTLSGEEGREISLLAEHGIIEFTETGAVAKDYLARVAAIESSPQAIAKLQRRFQGLKIYETKVEDLLHGSRLTRFPVGRTESSLKARIINLDMNCILKADEEDGEIEFPLFNCIKKIGLIHAERPKINWCLFLTLHGKINWSEAVCDSIQKFLSENFNAVPYFNDKSKIILGDDLHGKILSDENIDFSELPRDKQQTLLNIFVPKKLSQQMNDQGWKIETSYNLRYGREEDHHAPMVTWIIEFKKDRRGNSNPHGLYKENLKSISSNIGHLQEAGEIIKYD